MQKKRDKIGLQTRDKLGLKHVIWRDKFVLKEVPDCSSYLLFLSKLVNYLRQNGIDMNYELILLPSVCFSVTNMYWEFVTLLQDLLCENLCKIYLIDSVS